MYSSPWGRGLRRMGDHFEWGVAGRFSLFIGECTTLGLVVAAT